MYNVCVVCFQNLSAFVTEVGDPLLIYMWPVTYMYNVCVVCFHGNLYVARQTMIPFINDSWNKSTKAKSQTVEQSDLIFMSQI